MADSLSPTVSVNHDSPLAVDSAISEDDGYDTHTLRESLMDYPVHWGRTYHRYKAGSYHYPNDEPELERYDFLHHIFTRIHQSNLFFAPVHDARRILDIGTGTGIWPIELSDSRLCPDAQRITGIDLSPIQPSEVPDNVCFEIQDCTEQDWNRPLGSIDYIHIRMMLGSLQDPAELLRTAKRYLRPGTGWIEWHDPLPRAVSDDNSIPPKWPLREFEKALNRGAKNIGYPVLVAHKIRRWMEEAGYVDVHQHVNKLPWGRWPRDKELKVIGRMWAEAVMAGLSAMSYKVFNEGLGWTREEIEVFLMQLRQGMFQPGVHAYHRLYVVYGRRPSEEEEEEEEEEDMVKEPEPIEIVDGQ